MDCDIDTSRNTEALSAGRSRLPYLAERRRSGCIGLIWPMLVAAALVTGGCSQGPGGDSPQESQSAADSHDEYEVFAMNRRGMAFPDNDFSVSAIFPPANFLVAQVLVKHPDSDEPPTLADDSRIELRYSAVMDENGSINSVSDWKTNFWAYADEIYHFYSAGQYVIEPEVGFHGKAFQAQRMPGFENAPQKFSLYDAATRTFTAPYIPITPIDDSGIKNYFPTFRVDAVDKSTQQVLASIVVPLPMAEPMQCDRCHATGQLAADDSTSQRFGGLSWSDNPDVANNAKENIATLHSQLAGVNLTIRQPYLCAECHYSPIADPDGRGPAGDYQSRRNPLSISIHAWHALDLDRQLPASNSTALIPENGEASCKICHGGAQAYTRGSMYHQGIVCQDCHGGLIAVGKSAMVGASAARKPFAEEPRCESCHAGDEVSHLGEEMIFRKAFEDGDVFATPRVAINRRFAEQPATLYRNSVGHGAMTCISCHGSPHAEWPVVTDATHDNNIAGQLQGHAGSIIECRSCHDDAIGLTMDGPHGLHNVDDDGWIAGHGSFFDKLGAESCQVCHGLDLLGGRLSRVAAPRSFTLPDARTIDYVDDAMVGCGDCHLMPALPL